MVGKKYKLFKIIKPYLCLKDGEFALLDDAPIKVKRAYEEYINMKSASDES